eukprot:TRINITY_DN7263_c0_g2_i1.p1 TRINITY_DN7263_c0_g2~~TRINITY_DN7263_c0_g2_i1.p1  ORF type:complete len:369 (+),score=106.72 TRINITY_DN7263_c0_g2_i1:48-1109(+)
MASLQAQALTSLILSASRSCSQWTAMSSFSIQPSIFSQSARPGKLFPCHRVQASSGEVGTDATSKTESVGEETTKEELAARLAAAEAEAEALRQELALRKEVGGEGAKAAAPKASRLGLPPVDGVGYRETILNVGAGTSSNSKGKGPAAEPMKKWGLTEADLLAAGAMDSSDSDGDGSTGTESAESIVRRRLAIGLVLSVGTIAFAFVKLPTSISKPSKPLFFYISPLLQLQTSLKLLLEEGNDLDVDEIRVRLLSVVGPMEDLKSNLLSTATFLENDADAAVAFELLSYINQADYQNYFDPVGRAALAQQSEWRNFSLSSIKAAVDKLETFLSFLPSEAVQAAATSLEFRGF